MQINMISPYFLRQYVRLYHSKPKENWKFSLHERDIFWSNCSMISLTNVCFVVFQNTESFLLDWDFATHCPTYDCIVGNFEGLFSAHSILTYLFGFFFVCFMSVVITTLYSSRNRALNITNLTLFVLLCVTCLMI